MCVAYIMFMLYNTLDHSSECLGWMTCTHCLSRLKKIVILSNGTGIYAGKPKISSAVRYYLRYTRPHRLNNYEFYVDSICVIVSNCCDRKIYVLFLSSTSNFVCRGWLIDSMHVANHCNRQPTGPIRTCWATKRTFIMIAIRRHCEYVTWNETMRDSIGAVWISRSHLRETGELICPF